MTRRETQDVYEEINQILENLNKSDEQRKREKEEAEKARLLEEERKRNLIVRNTSGINGGEYKEDDLYAIPFETIDDFKRRIENANEKELRNERSLIKRNNTKLALLKEDFKHYKKISKKLKLWEFQRIGDASLRSFLYNIVLVLFVNIVTPFSVGLADLYIFAYIYSLLKEPIKEFRKVRKERSRCSEFLEGLNKEKRKIVDEKIEEIEKEYKNSLLEIKLKEEQEEKKEKIDSSNIIYETKELINDINNQKLKMYFSNLLTDISAQYEIIKMRFRNIIDSGRSTLVVASFSDHSIDTDYASLLVSMDITIKKILDEEKTIEESKKRIAALIDELNIEKTVDEYEFNINVSLINDLKRKILEEFKDFIDKYSEEKIRSNTMSPLPILGNSTNDSQNIQEEYVKIKTMKK